MRRGIEFLRTRSYAFNPSLIDFDGLPFQNAWIWRSLHVGLQPQTALHPEFFRIWIWRSATQNHLSSTACALRGRGCKCDALAQPRLDLWHLLPVHVDKELVIEVVSIHVSVPDPKQHSWPADMFKRPWGRTMSSPKYFDQLWCSEFHANSRKGRGSEIGSCGSKWDHNIV